MSKQKLFYIIIAVCILLSGFYFLNNLWRGDIFNEKTDFETNEKMDSFNNIKDIDVNKMYGNIYQSWWGDELSKKIDYLKSVNEFWKSSFLSSFIWDYSGALNDREKLCTSENQHQDFCAKKQMELKLWKVTDMDWNILNNVDVSVNWTYVWNLKDIKKIDWYNNFVHRVKFSKKWYLDFYSKIVLWNSPYVDIEDSPKLLKSEYTKTVKADESFTYKTKNFTYNIPADSFLNQDWSKIIWSIDIYFFDIWANNWDLNVLNLDVFSSNNNYAGSSFTSLWMPLIKAYSWNKELDIISDKISWVWKLQNLERAPWIDLNNIPKNVWLKKEELDKYSVPSFWYLDQKNWVWKASEIKMIDSLWNYEFKL
ncbi:MAG: hypothetical protein ACD_78C00258G0002 [uncultured bacterium (gcode 4)]|uniref:Uncharacterized protein n=1 Tax=uncultured bacterium (gcode 4) TaxID=1234023 RepID=K1YBX0_9BACT|nr:MAG: hypothetical protein ACD_78C00258G0002 [uncultured bacterium (gcode 4)]